MTANQHIDELAELYAIGALNDIERAQVDTHIRNCEPCAARVGEAESSVARLIEERAPSEELNRRMRTAFIARPSWRRIAMPVAAAFLIGLLPSIVLWTRGPGTADANHQAAISALINSHFSHVPFQRLTTDAPKAKLIYSPVAAWAYIIAQGKATYTVRLNGGSSTQREQLREAGNAQELFIPNRLGATRFLLYDGDREVARALIPNLKNASGSSGGK